MSLLLEGGGLWQDADALWQDAFKARERFPRTAAYTSAQREQAAFYARHGDFRRGAAIARAVQIGAASVSQADLEAYERDPKRRTDSPPRPSSDFYGGESEVAMSELVALDTWRTAGPESAVNLLEDPLLTARGVWDHGSEAARAELLDWLERRVALHMSILLDGEPTPQRIEAAYEMLSEVKGRYLGSFGERVRAFASNRGRPGTDMPALYQMIDDLAEARTRYAHQFIAAAAYGLPLDTSGFRASETSIRNLTEALTAQPGGWSPIFSLPTMTGALPPDSAFLDTVAWDSNGPSQCRELAS